jgi:iron(III) transport system permease protein
LVVVVAILAVAPVVAVAGGVLTPSPDVWAQLWSTTLPGMIVTTMALLLGVAAGTAALGITLAWLVTAYRFPGSRLLSWLLVMPLAIPGYVLGFLFLALLDAPGPVQSGLRSIFGADVWFPDVRSLGGAIIVLSLALYPYVYLLTRAALRDQAPAAFEAARTLGAGHVRAAVRVAIPLARPSIAAGLALVMMETLTDFGTVSYFNVRTVSVGIYQVWKGQFDRAAATELAGVVLVFALLVIAGERLLRGRARYHQRRATGRGLKPTSLTGARGWAATTACLAVLGAAFVVPVGQLVWWAVSDLFDGSTQLFDSRYLGYFSNSLTVAAIVAVACAALGFIIVNGTRFANSRITAAGAQLSTVGYAIPGVVVAIGVLVMFSELDGWLKSLGVPGGTGLLVTGSIAGVLYAYIVRFLALGYHNVDAGFAKVSPAMTASALVLGASTRRVTARVHLPLLRAGLVTAMLLVAVDALKELPIVLLLRPFGFDTLSVWTYQLASESRWESAALPALSIVIAALVPVLLLFGRERGAEVTHDQRNT